MSDLSDTKPIAFRGERESGLGFGMDGTSSTGAAGSDVHCDCVDQQTRQRRKMFVRRGPDALPALGLRVRYGSAALFVAGLAALQACTTDAVTARTGDAQRPAAACADLATSGLRFEGNTTLTAATLVTSGTLVTPNNLTLTGLPAFCRVQGVSRPTADSHIGFEVWLPAETWNGRFMSSGEGAYAGVANYTRKGLDGGLDEIIRRGYATASTDTGHAVSDAQWAVGHPERVVDYAYRAKHLVTVAAKGVIDAYYGRPAVKSYLNSCSNGGRQALMEVQRYPADYDGVVVGAPWNYQSRQSAGVVWSGHAVSEPGAALPPAKLLMIRKAVLAVCDAQDGLRDGLIEDPRQCRFDASSLLCQGADSNACLTAPQVSALKKLYEGPRNPRTGEAIYAGWAKGSETAWGAIIANAPTRYAYFRNLVYEDANWDYRSFNFDSDMAYADQKIGTLADAIEADMSAARARGVKVLMYHGWDDEVLQAGHTPQYYEKVAAAMGGLQETQKFSRLFMVPGMTHCYFGPGATSFGGVGQQIPPVRDATHDLQSALEAWVEKGIVPESMVATKYTDDAPTTRTVQLTRLLCPYPKVARYHAGDPNSASSFACVAP